MMVVVLNDTCVTLSVFTCLAPADQLLKVLEGTRDI